MLRPIAARVARSVVCVSVCLSVCLLHTPVSPAKPLSRSRGRLQGTDSRGPNELYVLDECIHIGATWRIRLNDPCAQLCGPVLNYFDRLFFACGAQLGGPVSYTDLLEYRRLVSVAVFDHRTLSHFIGITCSCHLQHSQARAGTCFPGSKQSPIARPSPVLRSSGASSPSCWKDPCLLYFGQGLRSKAWTAEARGPKGQERKWGWGQLAPSLAAIGSGNCCKLPNRDPGRAPAAKRFSCILEAPDGFSLNWLRAKFGRGHGPLLTPP